MDRPLIALRAVLIAAGIALAASPAAHAQAVSEDFDGVFWSPMLARGPAPGPGLDFGGPAPAQRRGDAPWFQQGREGLDGALPAPPMLRGLALTDAQRDHVFAILHAQAPLLREEVKAARRAQDQLRTLSISPQYDATRAKSLADAGARALGQIALLRADAEHRIYLVLTDEQREQVEATRRVVSRP